MASSLFLKGMLRKTALHQMSSNSSCREFIKRREMYEQEESAGKVIPSTESAKASFSDGSRQPPLAFTLGMETALKKDIVLSSTNINTFYFSPCLFQV